MEHISDRDLLEYLQRYGDQATTPPDEHLDHCAGCRRRWEHLAKTWQDLGCWAWNRPLPNLTEAVMNRVLRLDVVRLWEGRSLLRIAASVALGLAVGYWVASRTLSSTAAPTVPGGSPAQTASVSLEDWGLESATGWSEPLLIVASEAGR